MTAIKELVIVVGRNRVVGSNVGDMTISKQVNCGQSSLSSQSGRTRSTSVALFYDADSTSNFFGDTGAVQISILIFTKLAMRQLHLLRKP